MLETAPALGHRLATRTAEGTRQHRTKQRALGLRAVDERHPADRRVSLLCTGETEPRFFSFHEEQHWVLGRDF
jgi:hypothetical protein